MMKIYKQELFDIYKYISNSANFFKKQKLNFCEISSEANETSCNYLKEKKTNYYIDIIYKKKRQD